jgi:hypothetical protein
MKITLTLILTLICCIVFPQNKTIEITNLQRSQIENGYGMFIYYGINTFTS